MGTFNYYTSDYITLAFEDNNICDFDYCKDEILEEMVENGIADSVEDITDFEYEDYIYELISEYEQADYDNVKYALEDYNFYYFHVVQKGGYYYGSQLVIENNFGVAFDDYIDKRQAQKEITKIKEFLHYVTDCGMKATYPGWCPSWFDNKTTHKMIDDAIKEMREEVRNTPTWRQYERSCA